ncbi:DUF309 domain-containing protein, partial [Halorubrum sp. CBA1125]|uniref:DUF309 domain-containing protein n=1 Tax=Halorubrum sp. CBA1125 TaxID=2668072 RepID=UPI002AA2A46B
MSDREHGPGDHDDPGGNGAPGDADRPEVLTAIAAGAALFNEGHVLAAHDPWEEAWLPLDGGGDERQLHGLIAAAAATHHAGNQNWSGATGCAANGEKYLSAVGDDHRGVDVRSVREWCRRLAADPETIERARPPSIRIDGRGPRIPTTSTSRRRCSPPPRWPKQSRRRRGDVRGRGG